MAASEPAAIGTHCPREKLSGFPVAVGSETAAEPERVEPSASSVLYSTENETVSSIVQPSIEQSKWPLASRLFRSTRNVRAKSSPPAPSPSPSRGTPARSTMVVEPHASTRYSELSRARVRSTIAVVVPWS